MGKEEAITHAPRPEGSANLYEKKKERKKRYTNPKENNDPQEGFLRLRCLYLLVELLRSRQHAFLVLVALKQIVSK